MRSTGFVILSALFFIVTAGRSLADTDSGQTVRGKVVQVKPDQSEITIHPRRGKDLRLQVDDRSSIHIGKQNGQLRQLNPGDRVRVTYSGDHVMELSRMPFSAAEVRREIRQTLEEAKDYSFRQKDRYEQKLRHALDDTEDRIDELKEEAARKGGQFLQDHQEQIQEMREKAQVVRKKLDQVKNASADTWDKVKSDVGAALHDLHGAYDQLRDRFSK